MANEQPLPVPAHVPPEPAPQFSYVGRVLIFFAIAVLFLVAWKLQSVLLLAFAGALFAIILDAAARLITRLTGLGHRLALTVATLAIIFLGGGAFYLFGHEVTVQLRDLTGRLPQAWDDLLSLLQREGLKDEFERQADRAVPDGTTIFGWITYSLSLITGILSALFVAIIGGIYLAAQPHIYVRGIEMLVPKSRGPQVREALDATGTALRAWLFGQLISMLFTGIAVWLGLSLIGVPSSLALGLIAGLLGFIPMIGPLLGSAPGILVALSVDFNALVLTAVLYVIVQQAAGSVIEPLIMQRTVRLPPALTLFSLFGTGILFGPVGVILGGPLLVTAYALTRHLYVKDGLNHSLDSGEVKEKRLPWRKQQAPS